jgi:hypothetical protein
MFRLNGIALSLLLPGIKYGDIFSIINPLLSIFYQSNPLDICQKRRCNKLSIKIGNNLVTANTPSVKKGSFILEAVGDTYFDMSNWGKGSIWVNGHNLGRNWETGPQQTVYAPVEWIKKGQNEVVVLELLKPEQTELKGIDKPVLDQLKQ